MPTNDKKKKKKNNCVKWNKIEKGYFLPVTFSKGCNLGQKANSRAWNHADRSNAIIEWRTHLSNHDLNGISLHSIGFELLKKVLLVVLGIWLTIYLTKLKGKAARDYVLS